MGAMQVLKERKIKIPGQVALAGFSNDPFTSFTDPPLTTVDQLSVPMGRVTAEIFFDQLTATVKKTHSQKTVLKPELIIRQSSLKKDV
jgi:LacI family transcriptional regulator